jgi:hypothetical protein
MVYLSEILLLGISVLIAWYHSRLIKKNRPIYHGLWSAAYALLILAAGWWVHTALTPAYKLWLYGVAACAGHLVVFNVALNRFRGLSWTYVSKTSTSLIDWAELRLFGTRVWLLEVILAVVFLILQLFL